MSAFLNFNLAVKKQFSSLSFFFFGGVLLEAVPRWPNALDGAQVTGDSAVISGGMHQRWGPKLITLLQSPPTVLTPGLVRHPCIGVTRPEHGLTVVLW